MPRCAPARQKPPRQNGFPSPRCFAYRSAVDGMKGFLKILLYIVLLGLCVHCVKGFLAALEARMEHAERHYDDYDDERGLTNPGQERTASGPAEPPLPSDVATNGAPAAAPTNLPPATGEIDGHPAITALAPDAGAKSKAPGGLGLYGAGGLLSLLGLALMVAHDLSRLAASSAHKLLEGVEEGEQASREYEEAEQLWANADYLGAVHVLRDYLKRHPRRVHAHFRIAEIYEKDLNNTLAAMLEHEEILKFRLDDQRWGWAAIHLCNLYYHLNQPEKAEALLHRIVNEYGHTLAARKARKRLGMPEDGEEEPGAAGEDVDDDDDDDDDSGSSGTPAGFQLPRGFRPK